MVGDVLQVLVDTPMASGELVALWEHQGLSLLLHDLPGIRCKSHTEGGVVISPARIPD